MAACSVELNAQFIKESLVFRVFETLLTPLHKFYNILLKLKLKWLRTVFIDGEAERNSSFQSELVATPDQCVT